jgi:hypothetical protein
LWKRRGIAAQPLLWKSRGSYRPLLWRSRGSYRTVIVEWRSRGIAAVRHCGGAKVAAYKQENINVQYLVKHETELAAIATVYREEAQRQHLTRAVLFPVV